VAEDDEKWTSAELGEPIAKEYKLFGEGSFDLTKAAEFLKKG